MLRSCEALMMSPACGPRDGGRLQLLSSEPLVIATVIESADNVDVATSSLAADHQGVDFIGVVAAEDAAHLELILGGFIPHVAEVIFTAAVEPSDLAGATPRGWHWSDTGWARTSSSPCQRSLMQFATPSSASPHGGRTTGRARRSSSWALVTRLTRPGPSRWNGDADPKRVPDNHVELGGPECPGTPVPARRVSAVAFGTRWPLPSGDHIDGQHSARRWPTTPNADHGAFDAPVASVAGAFPIVIVGRLGAEQRPSCASVGRHSDRPLGPTQLVRNLVLIALTVVAIAWRSSAIRYVGRSWCGA